MYFSEKRFYIFVEPVLKQSRESERKTKTYKYDIYPHI